MNWASWLNQRNRRALNLPEYRRAAVLVALSKEKNERLLLTVRSGEMPTHGGQVAFAGGGIQYSETPVIAALREAYEEVLLQPSDVDILGELDDVFTPTGFHVTPVLAQISPEAMAALKPSPEVSEIITPLLSELKQIQPVERTRMLPNGQALTTYHYFWRGHDIWGMTARIIQGLLES